MPLISLSACRQGPSLSSVAPFFMVTQEKTDFTWSLILKAYIKDKNVSLWLSLFLFILIISICLLIFPFIRLFSYSLCWLACRGRMANPSTCSKSPSCGRTRPLCQQMKAERGSWAGTHHLLSCHCGLLFKEEINNCNKHQWARARCSVGPSAASAKPFCVFLSEHV